MAAMKRYPRSFLQLVTLGHLAVAIPLLLLACYAVFALDQLSERYQAVVEHVSTSGHLTGELNEDLQRMELTLRRHEILKNVDTLADYEEIRSEWRGHVGAFAQLNMLPNPLIQEFQVLLVLEESAHQAMLEGQGFQPMRAAIDEIRERSAKVHAEVNDAIARDQAGIRASSNQLLQHLVLAMVVAVSLAVLFLWLIRHLLGRLIGRFERAVLALGRGDLQTPILLDGPGDLRWLGRWLEWLRKRLMSLEEGRTQVLRHVSHELKTPLAALQEGSALLAEQVPGPLTPAQTKILGIVQTNARRLQDLIEGLLRLQQAGHAAERIGYVTLQYAEIVEQVIDTHRLIAQEQGIRFKSELQPLQIVAGHEALLTILHNLIANAVKFSPPGGLIEIRLVAVDGQGVLDVIDQGPGIAEKDRSRLFEPFFRGSATRQIAGVGLGLAIAREFVLAHRGTIEILATPGGGAHFRVSLPLTAPYLRKPENE